MHGVLLHTTIFPQNAMVFGFAFALSAMFWLGAGIYWIESFFFPLDGLRAAGVAARVRRVAVAACCSAACACCRIRPRRMFKLHFLIANIAYGLFAIAALHAILMLMVERRLQRMRGRHARGMRVRATAGCTSWLDTLPPLLTLEKLLFRLIGGGFRPADAHARVGHRCSASNWSTARSGSITRPCSRFFRG